jgi:hypothetical protein
VNDEHAAAISATAGRPIAAGDVELWVEQRGAGPDVLLLAGLSDPAEAWSFQLDGLADRYRLTAFDNRGAGRSPLPPAGFTVRDMADARDLAPAAMLACSHDIHNRGPMVDQTQHFSGPDARRGGRRHLLTPAPPRRGSTSPTTPASQTRPAAAPARLLPRHHSPPPRPPLRRA